MVRTSKKELSFGALFDKGTPKEELMKRFNLTDEKYEKTVASLKEIRSRKKEEKE